MKYFITIAAALVLSIAPAFAAQRLEVDVPFDFTAGRVQMPAGHCTVQIDGQGIVLIRHSGGGPAGFVFTTGVDSRSYPKTAKLVFNKYGDTYFLSQLWVPNSLTGRKLAMSPAEREIADRTPVRQVIVAKANSK